MSGMSAWVVLWDISSKFSGNEADWAGWSYKFESFAALCGWLDLMDAARAYDGELVYEQLGKTARRVVLLLLAQALIGGARLVRCVDLVSKASHSGETCPFHPFGTDAPGPPPVR